ncbi:uncharacterized protein K02A2.6-like [Mizuhopecten yessoensis]|uniref:uncharacterized protein K02A2.6-like n=1 Tax=Mizuhopecten yessoensis TaxID=6573 RepID=UPI000B458AC4|nr:uncharacterized protein K02A2.6-like [Mizuhopecten yessoensis]
MVGCDLFEFESAHYVLLVDYYSMYIDVQKLGTQSTSSVIKVLKSIFSCHGLPNKLRSDNGPQLSSAEFKSFCSELGIGHETSSPHVQSSYGEAERAIQTIKILWKKSADKQLALLDNRTTPLDGINLTPSQLLMGRRPRNTLPASKDILKPSTHDNIRIQTHFNQQKKRQKFYYDNRRGAKELSPLSAGDCVRISPNPNSSPKTWTPGTVVKRYNKPRSYVVASGDRTYRRNRKHLWLATPSTNQTAANIEPDPPLRTSYRRRQITNRLVMNQ